MTKKAFNSKGYEAKITFTNWKRAVETVKSGKGDALLGAYWTKERTNWLRYSAPLAKVQSGLFKLTERSDIIFNGNVNSLKKFKIGVGRGYSSSKKFDDNKHLKKVEFESSFQALKVMWKRKSLDLVAGIYEVDSYKMSEEMDRFKNMHNEITFIKPSLATEYLYLGFSKRIPDLDEIVRDFNVGVINLLHNEKYKK